MHVGIVGAGATGLATAWALQRRGHRVTVFEQGPVPNPLGSSVDDHRLIRFPYGGQAGYTAMVGEAYTAWEAVWADLGERLYVETGSLVYGTATSGYAGSSAATLAAQGIEVEWLAAADLRRLYPLMRTDEGDSAFRLPSGGALLARAIVAALARHVTARGGILQAGTAVRSVDPAAATLVTAAGDSHRFDRLVVAAGPWIGRLWPDLASTVTPSRQVVVYLDPPAGTAEAWAGMPLVLDFTDDPADQRGFFLVPPVAGTGLKVGDHRFSLSGDPDRDRAASRDEAETILEHCRPRIRDLDRFGIREIRVCFYTVEPQERFQVAVRDLAVAVSPCSGHGFKFASVMGLRLARLVAGEADADAVALWAAGGIPEETTAALDPVAELV
jgi:glycine/D-amino acid oxidase-like deaminating enzyme